MENLNVGMVQIVIDVFLGGSRAAQVRPIIQQRGRRVDERRARPVDSACVFIRFGLGVGLRVVDGDEHWNWSKCGSSGRARTLVIGEVRGDRPAHRASEARRKELVAQDIRMQRREHIAHVDLVAVIEHRRTCGRYTNSEHILSRGRVY